MKSLIGTYLALLALLALTVLGRTWPSIEWQGLFGLSIAATKAALIAWVFMSLRSGTSLSRLAAAAGLLWIFFFFFLSSLDIWFRPEMPGSSWR